MNMLIFETNEVTKSFFQAHLEGLELTFSDETLTDPGQLKASSSPVEAISVFVQSRVGASIMDALPALKLIVTRSTGFNHIDLAAAKERGIVVCNVPTYGENTVAEHTFALILSLSRNLHKAYVRTTSGNFSLEGLQGFDLKGKTLGVVGVGNIGLHVIRIGKGFGMNVLAYDPYPKSVLGDLLEFSYVGVTELLNRSDIVTIHAPLTPATHHLIGRHNFGEFKRGALLINTARGGIVDTDALIEALDAGILAGAGLDVVEGEEIISEEKELFQNPNASPEMLKMALRNQMLLRRPDMILTPHMAFDSREAVERILATTVDNIRAYQAGSPIHTVA